MTDQRLGVLIRQLQGRLGSAPLTAPFSLAAGATDTLAVPHGLSGTPRLVEGGVTGSESIEFVTWGWQADATNVTIYAKNHNTGTATVTVTFRASL